MNWSRKKVLVTGGASFIGSHLVEGLLARGADVRVVDNLSSGKLENLAACRNQIELIQGDLLRQTTAEKAVQGCDVVFHLAAIHGGRAYLDWHQAATASNFAIDGMLFLACREANVEKIVYASSGCVYPMSLQANPHEILFLKEDMVGPPYEADNLYGWAKLMAEETLRAYVQDFGMQAAACRYFTVYGERGLESHAVMAMIARAFTRQNPFVVWGTGEQIRNWTYVQDIVEGTILAAEKIHDGMAVNLGTTERTRVIEAVHEILRYTGHAAEIELHPEMPTGPYNRVADNSLARRLLGWQPKVNFMDGLHRTIDWYFATHDRAQVAATLATHLTER